MSHITKYPLIRLIIPMIVGMIGANYIYKYSDFYNSIFTLIPLIFTLIAAIVSAVKYSSKNGKLYFALSATIFCIILGFALENRSISKANKQYGERWTYELYKHNPYEIECAKDIQHKLHTAYHKHGLSGDAGSLVEAMTIGWKSELSKKTKNVFSRSGLSHVLALSGMHVSIIYVILQILLLGKITNLKWRLIANIITIIALWTFAFIAGMQPSLVRAVIMCSMMIIASCMGRKALSLNTLSFAAGIMLITEPLLLYHVGFQLSYAAVLGICVLGVPLCSRINDKEFIPGKSILQKIRERISESFISIVVISIACNIFTIPIVAYTFHQIPLLSVISNLMTTCLVTILMALAALWWLFIWCNPIHDILTSWLMSCSELINTIAEHISSLPIAVFTCRPTVMEVIMMYVIILFGTIFIRQRTSKSLIHLLITIILFSVYILIQSHLTPLLFH